jgi:hypothetical protein
VKLHLTAFVTAIALSSLALSPVLAANTPGTSTTMAAKPAAAATKTAATSAKKTATPDPKRFATAALARASCASDTVVWANTRSKIYHLQGTSTFGKGKNGAFMCQTDARTEGFKPTKTPEKVVSSAAK